MCESAKADLLGESWEGTIRQIFTRPGRSAGLNGGRGAGPVLASSASGLMLAVKPSDVGRLSKKAPSAHPMQPKGDPRRREIEDIAMFTLPVPSGIVASGTSAYSFHESRFLSVHAESGWFGPNPAFGYDNLAFATNRKAGKANETGSRHFSPRSQFVQEMDAFAARVAAGTAPHTPGAEGLQDMKTIAAIYQSAATGQAVSLPPSTGLDVTRGPWPKALGPFLPA